MQGLGDDIVGMIDVDVEPEDEDHFVTLQEEMGGGCAKPKRWLYGMWHAAQVWLPS